MENQLPGYKLIDELSIYEGIRIVASFDGWRYPGKVIDVFYENGSKFTIMLDEPHQQGRYHTFDIDTKDVYIDLDSTRKWDILQDYAKHGHFSILFELMDNSCAYTIFYYGGSSSGLAVNRREAIQKMYEAACIRGYIYDPSVYQPINL